MPAGEVRVRRFDAGLAAGVIVRCAGLLRPVGVGTAGTRGRGTLACGDFAVLTRTGFLAGVTIFGVAFAFTRFGRLPRARLAAGVFLFPPFPIRLAISTLHDQNSAESYSKPAAN